MEKSPPSFPSEIPINPATVARKRVPHPSEWVEPKLVVEMPSGEKFSLVCHVTTETQGRTRLASRRLKLKPGPSIANPKPDKQNENRKPHNRIETRPAEQIPTLPPPPDPVIKSPLALGTPFS